VTVLFCLWFRLEKAESVEDRLLLTFPVKAAREAARFNAFCNDANVRVACRRLVPVLPSFTFSTRGKVGHNAVLPTCLLHVHCAAAASWDAHCVSLLPQLHATAAPRENSILPSGTAAATALASKPRPLDTLLLWW